MSHITEALLEMHYFRSLANLFSSFYGAEFLRILKPSPREEAWVGFDQGWAYTSMSDNELLSELTDSIANKAQAIDNFYFGFFLQYKQVKKVNKKSTNTPLRYRTPYYRSVLDMKRNKQTHLSQHETLLRLNTIGNATAVYACPMIFDSAEVLREPDLSKLRIKSLSDAPRNWKPNSSHFLCYQSPDDGQPIWKSEDVKGKAYSLEEWVTGQLKDSPKPLSKKKLFKLIHDAVFAISPFHSLLFPQRRNPRYMEILPDSMTIMKFRSKRE